MIGWSLISGVGRRISAAVEATNALRVASALPDVPPVGTPNRARFFNAKLGSTGADGGTVNQNVNGAVTPQEFYIEAAADYDLYICQIIILIADTAIVHNAFGNVAALANGWDLIATESGLPTPIISKAKTGGQVIAFGALDRPFGDGALSFELSNWTGTEDAQLCSIDMAPIMPSETKGIRLGRGTKDRITSTVNDDLTGLTEFTVRVLGYRHYPA